jgi:membrane-bound lytic murein transglycosylase B
LTFDGWGIVGAAALSLAFTGTPAGRPPGVAIALGSAQGSGSQATPQTDSWSTYKVRLAALARLHGVHDSTIQSNVPGLSINWQVIELERTEPLARSSNGVVGALGPYLRSHVTGSLIRRGQENYFANYNALRAINQRYGVDPAVLMAIWGLETSYGTVTGSTDLLQALASLGYYGRRREFFESEFVAALKLMDEGVPRWRLKGSWAGATGYPQFLPSTWLRLAVDADGDGRADIWQSAPDALASIAHYLSNAGWRPNVPWGLAVTVPAGLDRESIRGRLTAPRCPRVHDRHSRWLTIGEWRRLGIASNGALWPRDSEMASLLEPDGPGRTAYLLTVNYRVILDYNCSNFYALSVGLLADAIAR